MEILLTLSSQLSDEGLMIERAGNLVAFSHNPPLQFIEFG